jgi:hypothetical protein
MTIFDILLLSFDTRERGRSYILGEQIIHPREVAL